jgi:hypothetical protein
MGPDLTHSIQVAVSSVALIKYQPQIFGRPSRRIS